MEPRTNPSLRVIEHQHLPDPAQATRCLRERTGSKGKANVPERRRSRSTNSRLRLLGLSELAAKIQFSDLMSMYVSYVSPFWPCVTHQCQTNLPSFRTTQYRDVRRLHSEFVKLAEHFMSANPETIVSAVPQPVSSAGAGTEEDETRVKAMMQRWFNYVCSNEVLMRDDEMILFVESDFGYSPMVKKKQPATGMRRKILKQFAPPPDDTPELSAARPIVKLFYLGTMDAGHKVDKLVKSRRGESGCCKPGADAAALQIC